MRPRAIRTGRFMKKWIVLVVAVFCGWAALSARGDAVTKSYTAQQTYPVPPASNFSGSGGGDGWDVSLSSTAVFNVHHHNNVATMACRKQVDASQCWTAQTKTATDPATGANFGVYHPGTHIRESDGHLFVFAVNSSTGAAGALCLDTNVPNATTNPFCGFTPLRAGNNSYHLLSNGVVVGNRFYTADWRNGINVSVLCFDFDTGAACPNQPFSYNFSSTSNNQAPVISAIGTRLILPAHDSNRVGCFDTATSAACTGSWPVAATTQYSMGAPFPLLNSAGTATGVCMPNGAVPCFGFNGASVTTPSGLAAALGTNTQYWNGPAVTIGSRVYVPTGSYDRVNCYDYGTSAVCPNFPHPTPGAGYMYTVNVDPQRPSCLWVNADYGNAQIQNFDAFTGGKCGVGAINALASQFVPASPNCTPQGYTKLQVVQPARSGYSSGAVSFLDSGHNPLPGIADKTLDANGSVDLTGLDLNQRGLPQFQVTLSNLLQQGDARIELSWIGPNTPECGGDGDFGDAPAPYPTLRSADGAAHAVRSIWLGDAVTSESEGQPSANADADSGDDGVLFSTLRVGETATLTASVTGGSAMLDAWIDFNRDGDWKDAGERIADHAAVVAGTNMLSFTVPAGATVGSSFARVRLSTAGVAAPTGPAADGEVEDLKVSIVPPTLSINSVSASEGNSGTTPFTFTITSSRAIGSDVFVDVTTATGTAGASDFVSFSQTVEIPAGQITTTFTVAVNGDTTYENDETFTVVLSSPMGATIDRGTGTGTIVNDDAAPVVTISPATRAVGESAGAVSFTVQLSNPSSLPVSVPFSVAGSASSADYSGLTASPLSFPEGVTARTISLTVSDDAIDEPNETVVLNLGAPTNATLGNPSSATLTIQDNDAPPTVRFEQATPAFDEDAGTVTSRLILSGPSAFDITVPVSVTGGSADGADFAIATPSPVTIPAGNTSVDLAIAIIDDAFDENDETIELQLGAPTNATITAPFTQTITIRDDDATPSMSFDMAGASYDEDAGTVMIPVRLSAASGLPISASFATGGSASAADYSVPTTSPLEFPAGSTATSIVLNVANDALDEGDETVTFTLSAPVNATLGAQAAYTATIVDDDAPPTLSFETAARTVNEGVGTTSVDVLLSAPSGKPVTFSITTGGTAGSGDFGGLTPSPITIPAGAIRATVSLDVTDDAIDESNESVVLGLSSMTNATLGSPGMFNLIIADNDDPPSVAFVTAASSYDESAGTVSVTLRLSAPSGLPVSVPFTAGGAIGANGATVPTASPVVIPAGSVEATIAVAISDDALDEFDQTVTLALGAPTNAASGSPSVHTLTIVDNDATPSVRFTVAAQSVPEGAGAATVTVQLSAASGKAVSVPVSYSGTAASPGDYTAGGTVISLPAGATSGSVTLSIVNDAAYEAPNETVVVSAGTPTNATLASPGSQTVTIVDDDAQAVASLVVTPPTATRMTLDTHCVSAHAADVVGTALPNVSIAFDVAGQNPTSGAAATSTSGDAGFCWVGTNAGRDTVTARFGTVRGTARIDWTKRDATLDTQAVVGVVKTVNGFRRIVLKPRAYLRDQLTSAPIAGREVKFAAGVKALCTGITDATGLASCDAMILYTARGTLNNGYKGTFSGDTTYRTVTDKGQVVGFQ